MKRRSDRHRARAARRRPTDRGQAGRRQRPDPGRHDGLLHVLRRLERGAHDPHRGRAPAPCRGCSPRRRRRARSSAASSARCSSRSPCRRSCCSSRAACCSASTGVGSTRSALLTLVGRRVASGLALLVISAVRTPAQAGAIGAGVYLVLALLGGNFTGTATVGSTFATMQKLTPNGWLISGWDTAMRGGGERRPTSVPPSCGVFSLAVALRRGPCSSTRRGAALQAAVRVSRILTLARKDLLETRRDRLSALFILVMPLAFTTFFGLLLRRRQRPAAARSARRRRRAAGAAARRGARSARRSCASCPRAPPTSSPGWPTAGRPPGC